MNAKNNLRPKPQPKPKPGLVKVVRALYNYTAKFPDELSFEEGDLLYVYDRSHSEWWKATCGSKKGLIASNYVEENVDEILDPLHEAARRGNLSFLKECLSNKVSTTGLDSMGNTALYWASHSGHKSCLLYLLKQTNSPINAKNHFGDTPLHAASAKGHYDIVEALLRANADPTIENNSGKTAEMLALNLNVKNLLQKYAIKNVKSQICTSPEEYDDDSD